MAHTGLKWQHSKLPEGDSLTAVVVTNISKNATDQSVRDFFIYCGNILQFELQTLEDSRAAFIEFEKESAARTALLLTSAVIVDKPITIAWYNAPEDAANFSESAEAPLLGPSAGSTANPSATAAASAAAGSSSEPVPPAVLADRKFATRVVAEIIADGYILSDQIVQRAKKFDEEHKVVDRVQVTVVDTVTKVADYYREVAVKYNLQEKINNAVASMEEVDKKYQVRQNVDYVANAATSLAGSLFAAFTQTATEASNMQQCPFIAQTQIAKQVSDYATTTSTIASSRLGEIRAETEVLIRERAPNLATPAASSSSSSDATGVPLQDLSSDSKHASSKEEEASASSASTTATAAVNAPSSDHNALPPYSELQHQQE